VGKIFKHWRDRRVWLAVWPICMSFIPLGIAFGVLAQKLNFSPWEVLGLSTIVYAGSAQFIGVSMISGGFSMLSIVLTTFVVNLRHFLFSSTLAPYFKESSKSFISLFTYGLTDEAFAVNIREFGVGNWSHHQSLMVNFIIWLTWVSATVFGAVAGEWLAIDLEVIGFGLTAMFIGLWSFYLQQKPFVVVGFLGGFLAVLLYPFVSYKLHLVGAAVIAATIGCIWECRGEGGLDE